MKCVKDLISNLKPEEDGDYLVYLPDSKTRPLCIRTLDAFEVWIGKKGLNLSDLRKLKMSEFNKLWLRYKHGLSNDKANQDIEDTKQYLYGDKDNFRPSSEAERISFEIHQEMNKYKERILNRIGITNGSYPPSGSNKKDTEKVRWTD